VATTRGARVRVAITTTTRVLVVVATTKMVVTRVVMMTIAAIEVHMCSERTREKSTIP